MRGFHCIAVSPRIEKKATSWVICIGKFQNQPESGYAKAAINLAWRSQLSSNCAHLVISNIYRTKRFQGSHTTLLDDNTLNHRVAKHLCEALSANDDKCYLLHLGHDRLGSYQVEKDKWVSVPVDGDVVASSKKIGEYLQGKNIKEKSIASVWTIGHGMITSTGNGKAELGDGRLISLQNSGTGNMVKLSKWLKPQASFHIMHCKSGGESGASTKPDPRSAVAALYAAFVKAGRKDVTVIGMRGNCWSPTLTGDGDIPGTHTGDGYVAVGGGAPVGVPE